MSATDELRKLLDEHGVRWTACSKATIDNQTFCGSRTGGHTFTEFQDGLAVTNLTPAQAIEATLGRGELERENAKLRELVRAAWKCIHSGLSCSDCRLVAGGCTLESAIRELGVEVEE